MWVQNVFVLDGDDIKWNGVNYRLEGYDAPEIRNFRSKKDRNLERKRGYMAKFALFRLLQGARNAHMLPAPNKDRFGRALGVLLVDGVDVANIAIHQGWGVPYEKRQRVDWGDPRLPFPDLPLPPELEHLNSEASA